MKSVLAPSLLMLAFVLSGCAGDDDAPGGDAGGDETVDIHDNEFHPDQLTVAAGTSVHFDASEAEAAHTVTIHKASDPPTVTVHDENVAAGADTHFTFDDADTYHVWCEIHGTMNSGMAMVVTVE